MHKYFSTFKSFFTLKHIAVFLALLIMILVAILVGYMIGVNQVQDEVAKKEEQTRLLMGQIKEIAEIDDISEKKSMKDLKAGEDEIRRLKKELKEVLDNEPISAAHEYAPKDKKSPPPPPYKRDEKNLGSDAKLVIIIDDVSYERDVRAIKSTGLPLVMSFLPPSPRHPSSALLAQKESRYMVHLPLEALDFKDEEPQTLKSNHSEDDIAQRIDELKKQFPNAHYYNNHTGSKFTSDASSMKKLISVLKTKNIQFVDSRTIGQTKVPEATQSAGMRYIGRDVFLDHQDGVANIKKQIREAVEKAKKHGSAIAIGHPRPDTIEALKQSKAILSEVKLVGIDNI